MKKKLFYSVLLLLITCSSVLFALPADRTVKAVLDITNDNSSYNIGFTEKAIASWSETATPLSRNVPMRSVYEKVGADKIYSDGKSSTTVEVLYASSDKESNAPGIYVFWRILSFSDVDLSLQITGPLQNSSSTPLDWCVRWDYNNDVSNPQELNTKVISDKTTNYPFAPLPGGAELGPLPLAHCTNDSVYRGIASSVPLHIITDSLFDKDISAPYTGEISLIITIVG